MKIVVGEHSGAEYKIEKEIGRGAQGRVFSVVGGKYALKILGKKSSKKSQLLKKQISYIRTRDLSDLNISKPIEQIKGEYLGYIMEMATDMMPLEMLLKPSDEKDWWQKTGGLKKRLLLLLELSNTLTKLHSKGLIYGDLSPKNVYISNDPNYSEIYLIDVDNITHLSKVGQAVYTPGYGAPEVVAGISGSDTYTDDYSFSIIAYQLLTLNHPFIGDYVNSGAPELEDKAYASSIPWINNSTDTINQSSVGYNYSVTVPLLMMTEFKNTFEINLNSKFKRTSTLKWCDVIDKSINSLIYCEKCKNHYNYSKFKKLACPFCGTYAKYLGVVSIVPLFIHLKKEIQKEYGIEMREASTTGSELKRLIVEPNQYITIDENDIYLNNSSKELFKIKVDENKVYVKGVELNNISICNEKTLKIHKDIDIQKGIAIKYGDFFLFIPESNSNYQRVIKIRKYPE